MRPHNVLEDMAAIERRVPRGSRYGDKDAVNWHLWDIARRALQDAVTFDFGAIAPTPEHADFGQDLLERGMMALPFPATFYASTALGTGAALLVTEAMVDPGGDVKDHEIAPGQTHPGDPHFALFLINETHTPEGECWHAPSFVCFLHKADPMNRQVPWVSVINAVRKDRQGNVLTPEDSLGRVGHGMRFMCGAASMLISRDVQTRIEPAPAKLNAQRERKGRPTINAVHTIKVVAGADRYLAAGESFGTHASPRMHWRRGHFRTLHRGEEGERIVPVAPSLVGACDDARHIVPMRSSPLEVDHERHADRHLLGRRRVAA